ncbi:hypothetical protein PIB30_052116 [Stylosanthes scabra]|uniref:Uncharacterized protein n=1 Tax=Stylosanthes scabra TaxID=79078 RepID=A0ABU6UHZ7_9FABA|nr:hypothetical protein [Stylosanthes scabra]
METTKSFVVFLSRLWDHVRASDFEFDRSDVRYLKVRNSTHKFTFVQFGVFPSVGTLPTTPSSLIHVGVIYCERAFRELGYSGGENWQSYASAGAKSRVEYVLGVECIVESFCLDL